MPEQTQDPLTSTRAVLGATDTRFADADRLLLETVRDAHRVATESTQQLAAIGAEVDAAVARRSTATSAAGQEFGRFLLAKNREIADIIAAARAAAEAKAVVLQSLVGEYRSASVP